MSKKLPGGSESPGFPETVEDIKRRYYERVLLAKVTSGDLIFVSGDEMKNVFGGDYAPERSDLYAIASYQTIEKLIGESSRKELVFLAGGPGAGKTDIVGQGIVDSGYSGILYDTTFSHLDGVKHLINMARQNELEVRIYGILANLERARVHTIIREHKIGREVPVEAFARGHVGFVETLRTVLQDGNLAKSEVRLLDLRTVRTAKEAIQKVVALGWESDPLVVLEGVDYNRNEIKGKYAKENFDKTTGQRIK